MYKMKSHLHFRANVFYDATTSLGSQKQPEATSKGLNTINDMYM